MTHPLYYDDLPVDLRRELWHHAVDCSRVREEHRERARLLVNLPFLRNALDNVRQNFLEDAIDVDELELGVEHIMRLIVAAEDLQAGELLA